MSEDARWMRSALGLGARGLGTTWPNPSVGCVIVRDGRVVGRGHTQPGGRPHAEVVALRQAGADARGATAYVTLEPCAHEGKSPPCTEALIAAGVARVVAPCPDPDPRVAGRGFARLRAAGIEVAEGCLAEEAAEAHAGFFLRVREGRPLVTLKLATSLDGRIATGSGDSRWITGPEARRRVHLMRARHDAVMVGIGTALADDPDLRVRLEGLVRQTVRVVLDSRLRLPPDSRLARSARECPVWVLHGPGARPERAEALAGLGVRLIEVPAGERGLEMRDCLAALGREGLTRVLCEGGGQIAASLLGAGLADRLALFTAGVAIGAEGQPGVGALGLGRLAEAPRLRLHRVERVGADVLSEWRAG